MKKADGLIIGMGFVLQTLEKSCQQKYLWAQKIQATIIF